MSINLSYAVGNAVTVTNTETSMVSGTTTLQTVTDVGMYRFWVDGIANMAKGDEYLIKVKEKIPGTSGTQRVVFQARITDAQSEPWVSPPIELGIGWDATLTRVSATSRALDWRISRVF